MKDQRIQDVESLLKKAGQALFNASHSLKKASEETEEGTGTGGLQLLQMLLQYRLDTQDGLLKLCSLDRALLQLLGIESLHSMSTNLERVAFALGHDALPALLNNLTRILDALRHTAHHYDHERHSLFMKKPASLPINKPVLKGAEPLQQALLHQQTFRTLLCSIHQRLVGFTKTEAIEPLYDHIAGLRGPISEFFQGEENGLELSHALYEKINHDVQFEKQLENTLKYVEMTPKPFAPKPTMKPLPNTVQLANEERLAERAAARRTGNFFSYSPTLRPHP